MNEAPNDHSKAQAQHAKEAFLFNHQLALLAHEGDSNNQADMFKSSIEFALIAIRTTTLISGGSAVVALAFVGNLYSSEPMLAGKLVYVVALFAFAALSGGGAALTAYVTQHYYAQSSFFKEHTYEHPYVERKTESFELQEKGKFWHKVAVALCIMSFSFIFIGICGSMYAFSASTSLIQTGTPVAPHFHAVDIHLAPSQVPQDRLSGH